MATTVGALSVDLDLNSANFINNMKRAVDTVEKSASSMQSALNVGKAAVGGFLAVFAVDKIREVTMAGLEYASSLGEQAQQLGINTREMQVYRYAASQVGISNEEMDKGLAKLTLHIGQAADGNKSLAAVFSGLGIAIKDGSGHMRSAGDVMEDLTAKLSKIPDPARRAEIEVALFGKTGQRLDTMLAGGSAALTEMTTAAEKLGIVLDDKLINQADEAADKLAAMKQVIDAKMAAAVADNAQAFLSLADAIGVAIDKVGYFFTTMRGVKKLQRDEGWASGFFSTFDTQAVAADPRQYANKRGNDFITAQSALGKARADAANDKRPDYFGVHKTAIANAEYQVSEAKRLLNAALSDPDYVMATAAKNQPHTTTGGGSGGGAPHATGKTHAASSRASQGKTLEEEFAAIESSLDPLKRANDEFEKTNRVLHAMEDQGKITTERFDQLRDAAFTKWRDQAGILKETPAAIKGMSDQIDIAIPKFQELHIEILKLPTALDQAFGEAKTAGMDAFISGLEGMRHGFGSLKDVALGVLDAIESALLNKLVYGPLRDWANGGGGDSGGGLGGLLSSVGSFFSKMFGGKKAAGGNVDGSRTYLVGEEGPELFVPGGQGTIIPHDVLRHSAGANAASGGITFNFHGPVTNPEQVRRSAAQAAAHLARLVSSGKRGV